MRDEDKSKPQLILELQELRQQLEAQQASALTDRIGSALHRDELILSLRHSRKELSDSLEETAASHKKLTESREALRISEQKLIDANERYNILGDLIPFGVWTANAQGQITFLSEAFLEMSGLSSRDIGSIEWVDQLVRPKVLKAISDWSSSLYERDIWENEFTITSKNERQYSILIRGVPLMDQEGKVLSWLGINLDISQRKRAEENLLRAKEESEKANIAKSMFLANMSHEIRTPMNGIMGMLQLVNDTALDVSQREYIKMALASTRRLNQLLSDILNLTRIEAGKMEIKEETFSIADIAERIKELFTLVAKENENTMRLTVDEHTPEKLIGDPTRLTQILFNLVGNAMKYTQKGRIEVDISPLPISQAGTKRLLFTVCDTGIGIPEHKIHQVFEIFTQVEHAASPYTREFEGAGLGLPLVERMAKLLSGSVCIASWENEGTTVYVSLPFKMEEASSETHNQKERYAATRMHSGYHAFIADEDLLI
jgi:PAS domain S-box-containing protein